MKYSRTSTAKFLPMAGAGGFLFDFRSALCNLGHFNYVACLIHHY